MEMVPISSFLKGSHYTQAAETLKLWSMLRKLKRIFISFNKVNVNNHTWLVNSLKY